MVFDIGLRLLEAFRDSSVAIIDGEVQETILCHLYSMLLDDRKLDAALREDGRQLG